MNKKRNNKRALVISALSLLLCVTMLVGSTFAWFTDNATTSVNTIQAGTLDIDIQDTQGTSLNGKTLSFVDSNGANITKNILWEPGCTYILQEAKLVNLGNLALKFRVDIKGITGDMELANVIDVKINGVSKGTLADLMADTDGAAYGYLLPKGETGDSASIGTISLHMQETAGNQYQGKSISGLAIAVSATQYTYESDSNNNQYDANAAYSDLPVAQVTSLEDLNIQLAADFNGTNASAATLDVGYVFAATDTVEAAQASAYRYYHADFVVSANNDIAANALTLAGQYDSWNENWIGLSSNTAITKGTEIRLLQALMPTNTYVNYEGLCETIKEFNCGLIASEGANLTGTTITVELRLYATEEASAENSYSHNVETGEYIVIGTYSYTY